MSHYQEVIEFWFEELNPKSWWIKDRQFDQMLAERFGTLLSSAIQGELFVWREEPLGRLAEIVVLDQFSRNIYRDDARSFSADPTALVLAQEAVRLKAYQGFTDNQKQFLFMPFMHSESLLIHEQAIKLFSEHRLDGNLDFEIRHKEIIERFGRYPHRNLILGRESTLEEIEFLKQPGSSF